jgi:hypothetical protein
MRWTIAHALIVVLIVGLALAIHRLFWGDSSYFDSRILFSAYIAVLTTTSLAAYSSRPPWRRFWLGYVLFGWSYLCLVLRGGFGFTPDFYAKNLSNFSLLGMMLGLICALVAHIFPGLRE